MCSGRRSLIINDDDQKRSPYLKAEVSSGLRSYALNSQSKKYQLLNLLSNSLTCSLYSIDWLSTNAQEEGKVVCQIYPVITTGLAIFGRLKMVMITPGRASVNGVLDR